MPVIFAGSVKVGIERTEMLGRITETIVLLLKGCAIGVANIIPGVSGGTIAVVVGVYDRLIESIACFFESPLKRKENILFLMKIL